MKDDFHTKLSMFQEEIVSPREVNGSRQWALGITEADAIFKYQTAFRSHQQALQAIDHLLNADPDRFVRDEDFDEEGVVVYAREADF